MRQLYHFAFFDEASKREIPFKMRLPIARERPLEDEKVDRSGVEVQRCMERTDTNRSKALPKKEVIRF